MSLILAILLFVGICFCRCTGLKLGSATRAPSSCQRAPCHLRILCTAGWTEQHLVDDKIKLWAAYKESGKLSRPITCVEDVDKLDEDVGEGGMPVTISPASNILKTTSGDQPQTPVSVHTVNKRLLNLRTAYTDSQNSNDYASALWHVIQELVVRSPSLPSIFETAALEMAKIIPYKKIRIERKQIALSEVHVNSSEVAAVGARLTATAPTTLTMLARRQVDCLELYLSTAKKWGTDVQNMTAFAVNYVLQLLNVAGSYDTAVACRMLLIQQRIALGEDFLPGEVCAAVHRAHGSVDGSSCTGTALPVLQQFATNIVRYPVTSVNLVLRALSRYHQAESIISLLRAMRDGGGAVPDGESMEMLTNAVVQSVGKGVKALSMSSLPPSSDNVPEVRTSRIAFSIVRLERPMKRAKYTDALLLCVRWCSSDALTWARAAW
jgi:hypothetical protein